FSASRNSKSREVAILISKWVPFQMSQIITDSEGCCIIVQGSLHNKLYTLINVYTPNVNPIPFFPFRSWNVSPIIMGGDYNLVLNAEVDRLARTLPSDRHITSAIKEMMRELGFVDIWRMMHEKDQDNVFFSQILKSYSRIVMFLISTQILEATIDSKIDHVLLSDHMLLYSHLFPHMQQKEPTSGILTVPFFETAIREGIEIFKLCNQDEETSLGTKWEMLKVVLRGKIISNVSYKKKLSLIRKGKKRDTLESQLNSLEAQHNRLPEDETIQEALLNIQLELRKNFNHRTDFALFRTKHKFYE
uniref:Endonuclease/exonuclease/phosphatase domain-containing protein n=1 Tax=Latimeria chalumnae TaxID=7897 RepID=H3B0V6_LATCH